jgi:exodeoxyribonuclease-3
MNAARSSLTAARPEKPEFSPRFNMLRVITLNLNGIRSAAAKGYLAWLVRQKADCVCMQEIKAQESDLPKAILMPGRLKGRFDFAHKKGYSGVGLYCAREPDAVTTGIGSREFDPEGRFLRADFGKLSIVSIYLPSGSSSAERQQAKFRFMKAFMPVLRRLAGSGREFILCGDWNIAHKEIDLRNWRSNQKNSGFLPEERAWLSEVFESAGWVDVFRRLDPRPDQYTWWSNRGQAWAKNVGWRIDYQIATPGIAARALRASIYKARRFSDHAPLTIDYDWAL